MENNTVELIIEGNDNTNGHPQFDAFLKQLQFFENALKSLDKELHGGDSAINFSVVNLSHNSPATIAVKATPRNENKTTLPLFLAKLKNNLAAINDDNIDSIGNIVFLENILGLANSTKKKLKSTKIQINNQVVFLNFSVADKINSLLKTSLKCYTTYEGMLDQINIHRGSNNFYIYPISGPFKIKCHFPQNLVEKGKNSLGKKITVTGFAKYLPKGDFPFEMEVNNIEIYQSGIESNIFDLRGIAPELTGNLTSEDFISRNRDEWD